MAEQPCIRGTRLTVHHILKVMAFGVTADDILQEYDGLTQDDVSACLLFASESLSNGAALRHPSQVGVTHGRRDGVPSPRETRRGHPGI
jgi:uncharacterized protein (DUF433 family)